MRTFLAAFFALLFSFGHHAASARTAEASLQFETPRPSAVLSFPDRQDLARTGGSASYAGAACLSCRTTNASFVMR